MNTNNLKRFAQQARRMLLEQVGARLTYVLTTDTPELRERSQQINQLKEELKRTTQELLVEKVAYTWFNRLMAHRFMDVNDYQPLGIKVITPKTGYTQPELLDVAKQGAIPDKLKVNQQKIYNLLDGKISSHNPQNEVYKELLIAASNHLHTVLPFLFERINDYTELLVPDDLTSEFSIVSLVREGMLVEDCKNVEIIGWLYQFYISEEKDRLINAKRCYKTNEIPAVTQLFTPKWIVQYMVDNTLGQLWAEAHPTTSIFNSLEFYIKPENSNLIPHREIKSPESIKFFDPCVGSAHILCYAFDVFFKIYAEEGYNEIEIPELIIRNNLFGTDIDDRAAQLAGFALMMKAVHHSPEILQKGIIPNIVEFISIEGNSQFKHAKTYGSLIKVNQADIDKISIDNNSIFSKYQEHLKKQSNYLAQRYDIVVTNPPYLNSSYMDNDLKEFIEREYKSTKSDLFACFLVQMTQLTKQNGLIGFVSPYVWMFISSYIELREIILDNTTISSLIQLEYNAFEPACVPIATFILRNNFIFGYKGSYVKLSEFKGHTNQAPKTLEAIHNHNCGYFYISNQENFKKIPRWPIGYWVSENFLTSFEKGGKIESYYHKITKGAYTGNNDRFIRLWYEISNKSDYWIKYNKAGGRRKWYGLGMHLISNKNDLRTYTGAGIGPFKYFGKPHYSWGGLTSGAPSFRLEDPEVGFDDVNPSLIGDSLLLSHLGFLNSNVSEKMLNLINPTLHYQIGDIKVLPILDFSSVNKSIIEETIKVSKLDWNNHEYSWDFCCNPLICNVENHNITIEEAFDNNLQFWSAKYFSQHRFEEEINRIFINIYGLEEEQTPIIPIEDITILQDELNRKTISLLNNKLIRDPKTLNVKNYYGIELPFNTKEIMSQFISYAVGCMFGRYSLDKEKLILANQGETLQDYLNKIGKTIENAKFLPDEDNVIPILDNEWFEDDITTRFKQFLKVTFGTENFEKNLNFIEDQIGKDIRTYFIKDFYPDQIKRYKKRPIYWMFSSPKGAFNVLIYLHRYTPDTINIILNKYLREFMKKLKARLEHLQHIEVSGSASEKTKAIKERDDINSKLIELSDYEREIMYPLATERIAIDLDDGVLVNYNKFGKAVKEVPDLNDKKTKDAVKKFDWIDTKTIR